MKSPTKPVRNASLPPRWVIRTAWTIHRALYRITGGRFGLRRASKTQWGMMRLKTLLTAAAARSGR